jgi:hypothetical protein
MLSFLSARDKLADRLVRRSAYRIAVQLPDRTIVYMSVHTQAQHHEVVAGLLGFTNVGGRHGKYYAGAWALWLSEPDRPALALADDVHMIDVLLSCPPWRDHHEGVLFLLRKQSRLPDAARATTAGLPSTALPWTVPVR